MKKIKKQFSICLSFTMVLSLLYTISPVISARAEEIDSYNLSNPKTDSDGVVTWDCIYFGNYWQNDTNGDGVADQNDEKQPIKWRVLSVNGDDAFLLADQNLDYQPYNEEPSDVTWETCTLRQWINNEFFQNAFDSSEQSAVQITTIKNEDNPKYGTKGGNNTTDKVYLLSVDEAENPEYGFVSTIEDTKTRKAQNTEYACGQSTSNSFFWLRSPGKDSNSASNVGNWGGVNQSGDGVIMNYYAVRPVLHLNLSSNRWIKTDTLTSSYGLSRPRIGNDSATIWDCIYFGYYWQNDTNGDGMVNKNDAKQPIKWRVLSVNGDDAFLLADQNLDCKRYNEVVADVTWRTCTLHQWLNYDFYQDSFNVIEQRAILTDEYGDKVSLLTDVDAGNSAFGFRGSSYTNSDTRKAQNTEYAKALGAYYSAWWWLQTQGDNECKALVVDDYGAFDVNGIGVDDDDTLIRPVLHLNLLSNEWCKAGTISSAGVVTSSETAVPTARPVPTTTPDIKEDIIPSPKPTITPITEENSQEISSIEFDSTYYTMTKGTVITIPRPIFSYLELKENEWGHWGYVDVPIPSENTKNEALTWISSNPEICTVDADGNVYAKNYGITNITAKTENQKYDTVMIEVCKPSLFDSSHRRSPVQELNEVVNYKVSYTGNNIVEWSLSKKNVLKIESKENNKIKLRAIKPGKVTLYAKIDGLILKRNIKVLKPRLELKKLIIKQGKKKSTYVISSEYLAIKWKCKNKKIVSLSHDELEAEIKGKKKGKTWVTAKIETKGIKYKPNWKIRVIVK